jgi:hypothetical protein
LLEKLARAFDTKARDYAAAGQMKFDIQHDVLDSKLATEVRPKSSGPQLTAAG